MRPRPRGPEINVTPLVDVVLVLLIIFMVVVPQLEAGAAVTPPTARHPDKASELDPAFTIVVAAGGETFLDKQPVAAADLAGQLAALHKADPHRPLRIKGDRAVPYATVRDLYRMGQTAGFPGVGLEVGAAEDATAAPGAR